MSIGACLCISLYLAFLEGIALTASPLPFFSNPRLGSSDRQPREGILRWSCQPNHYMAAPHGRSDTGWDPQVWLHPANGAAEPAVSTCTYVPFRSMLPQWLLSFPSALRWLPKDLLFFLAQVRCTRSCPCYWCLPACCCACCGCPVPKLAHVRSAVEWKMLQNVSSSKRKLLENFFEMTPRREGRDLFKRWSRVCHLRTVSGSASGVALQRFRSWLLLK